MAKKRGRPPKDSEVPALQPGLPMDITQTHLAVINLLVAHRHEMTMKQIAEKAGVLEKELLEWRTHPTFQARYLAALRKWEANFEDVPYATRKQRMQELVSIYRRLPRPSREGVTYDEEGNPVAPGGSEDGKGGGAFAYDAMVRARLLKQMGEEMGQYAERIEITGPGGSPLGGVDLTGLKTEQIVALREMLEAFREIKRIEQAQEVEDAVVVSA